MANQEPLLTTDPHRFCTFPIKYHTTWSFYKKAVANFWTVEEIQLDQDAYQWEHKLSEDERHFIKHVLAFFAGADGIVIENLGSRFLTEVQIQEARSFYTCQSFIESIHGEAYSLLIDTYVKDPQEKDTLFKAIDTIPCVKQKADWAVRWIESSDSFAERLVAFACVEGILFSSSFCAIYWLKSKNLLPGLTFSNELIAKDEALHTDFACHLYRDLLVKKLPTERVLEIVKGAVEIEQEFACEALPVSLIGMNKKLMSTYIECVADRLLNSLGYSSYYGSKNPFGFMELISLTSKNNMFESHVSSYQKAGVIETLNKGKKGELTYGDSTEDDF